MPWRPRIRAKKKAIPALARTRRPKRISLPTKAKIGRSGRKYYKIDGGYFRS